MPIEIRHHRSKSKQDIRFYEVFLGSLNWVELENLGEGGFRSSVKRAPWAKDQYFGRKALRSHRRCQEFKSLITHQFSHLKQSHI
jgi:1,4-alpha-glucan branching enzyme